MTKANNNSTNFQSLMEGILSSLSSEQAGRPVALVIESPAHFPAIAVDHTVITNSIAEVISRILAWTNRQEVRVQARIQPTGNLPSDLIKAVTANPEHDREGPWALLVISDQHAAFAPDRGSSAIELPSDKDLLSIFDPIEQSLNALGVELWVEMLGTEGIRVWIALPLQPESANEADVARIRETVDTRIPEGSDSIKLLIQAESDAIRSTLSESLIEAGYDVVSVGSPGRVLPLARRELPDLIILDLQSRNPSALDLAVMIREDKEISSAPILLLTEVAGPGIGRRMDTIDFLHQSTGTNAILNTVDQVLHSRLQPAARVMVVEPEDELREQMLQTIQQQGYPVVEARSAEEALALAERVSIGLVLAEASLAQGRDYWLVRQLRQLSKDIEIYLITEGGHSIDSGQALRRGVTGYGDTGRLQDILSKSDPEETNHEGRV